LSVKAVYYLLVLSIVLFLTVLYVSCCLLSLKVNHYVIVTFVWLRESRVDASCTMMWYICVCVCVCGTQMNWVGTKQLWRSGRKRTHRWWVRTPGCRSGNVGISLCWIAG